MKLSLAPVLLASLAALAIGCSSASTEPSDPQPSGSPPAATTDPPAPPAPDPKAEACKAEDARLQAGLDGAHGASTDAALAIKTPACGSRVLMSGPSKNDPTKLHRIGSVTKTFVAAVILGLVKDGAVSLDDKLEKWVTGVPKGDVITVRQLMNHTSGIFNYTNDKTFAKSFSKHWTPREMVDLAIKNPPYFEPGAGWEYSNTNYILLGMIAESAGKAKIGALVRTRVLEKAGLKSTFFDGEEPIAGTLAKGFDASGFDATSVIDPSGAWAAGSIVATPADVATWIEKVGSGAFYDAATQAELLKPVATGQRALDYGLGIFVYGPSITAGGGKAIGHGGDIPGYHTQAFYFPEKLTTIVSIVDSDAEDPNKVSLAVLRVLYGAK